MDKKDEIKTIVETSDVKEKVIQLRINVMRGLLKDQELENEDFVNLSPADKITVTNEMKRIIAANPEIYGESSEIAKQLEDIPAPEKRTIGDNVASFKKEFIEQAKIKGGKIFFIAATVSIIAGVFVIVRPFIKK
jgi:hypothetical protein